MTWIFILYIMLARQQGGQDVQAVGDELESDWSVDLLPMGADGPSGRVQPSTSSFFVSSTLVRLLSKASMSTTAARSNSFLSGGKLLYFIVRLLFHIQYFCSLIRCSLG